MTRDRAGAYLARIGWTEAGATSVAMLAALLTSRGFDLDNPSPQHGGDPLGRAWSVRDDGGELVLVQHEADGSSRATYAFTLEPRALADYAAMCVYQQSSPDSGFTRRRICSRATPEGRVSLANDRLIVTTREGRTEQQVAEGERAEMLLREFEVVLDE